MEHRVRSQIRDSSPTEGLLHDLVRFGRERKMLEPRVILERLGDDAEQIVEGCQVPALGRFDHLLHAMVARDERGNCSSPTR